MKLDEKRENLPASDFALNPILFDISLCFWSNYHGQPSKDFFVFVIIIIYSGRYEMTEWTASRLNNLILYFKGKVKSKQ